MSIFLFVHICGAVLGLLSGFLAMLFRKGSGLHAVAGKRLLRLHAGHDLEAAWVARFERPNHANFLVAILTLYLVATAWVAAKRRSGQPSPFDRAALLVILIDGLAGLTWGLQAANSPAGTKDGMPAPAYFIFGSIALLCALSDLRMLRRGGVTGPHRIARHLYRMSLALLITTLSFYPGQAKLFSAAMRSTKLMFVPHVFLIGAILFWMVRMRRAKAAAPHPWRAISPASSVLAQRRAGL